MPVTKENKYELKEVEDGVEIKRTQIDFWDAEEFGRMLNNTELQIKGTKEQLAELEDNFKLFSKYRAYADKVFEERMARQREAVKKDLEKGDEETDVVKG